jgi:hypothetical protein
MAIDAENIKEVYAAWEAMGESLMIAGEVIECSGILLRDSGEACFEADRALWRLVAVVEGDAHEDSPPPASRVTRPERVIFTGPHGGPLTGVRDRPSLMAAAAAVGRQRVTVASAQPEPAPPPSTMADLRRAGARPLTAANDGPRFGWGTYDDDGGV